MANIGYARTSTREQNIDLQTSALKAVGCKQRDIYVDDGVSGKLADRPGLAKCLKRLRAGDTLTVWKLDRLGRSLPHLVIMLNELAERGVQFRSLTEAIDLSTSGGKLIFHMLAALAEFERDLIRERTLAGLDAAKTKGNFGGRPSALSREQKQLARQLHGEGKNVVTIARLLGVSRPTIYRALEPAVTAA